MTENVMRFSAIRGRWAGGPDLLRRHGADEVRQPAVPASTIPSFPPTSRPNAC